MTASLDYKRRDASVTRRRRCSCACADRCRRRAPTTSAQRRRRIEVAKGIYLFVSKPYGDVGLDGNSVAILSNDGVLVFDTERHAGGAAAVLAEIRQLTDKPVKYVVNSHWHWDHWYGTETYTHAFPDVKVVAHEKTREMMTGPAIEFNRPGLDRSCPATSQSLREARVAATTPQLPADCSTRTASSSSRRSSVAPGSARRDVHRPADADLGERDDPGPALRPRGHARRHLPVPAEGEDRRSPATCW